MSEERRLAVLRAIVQDYVQTSEPVGPFVVDIRGLMSGLPTTEGWTPVVPAGRRVPRCSSSPTRTTR